MADLLRLRPHTEQVAEIRFSEVELGELRHVLGVPPCIVVGGQDAYGKVLVVTRLLAEQVLPIVPRLTPGRAWRPVRLKHSHTRTVCLALPDHGSHAEAGYELVHSLHAHARPWGTVPRADVELDQRAMQVGGWAARVPRSCCCHYCGDIFRNRNGRFRNPVKSPVTAHHHHSSSPAIVLLSSPSSSSSLYLYCTTSIQGLPPVAFPQDPVVGSAMLEVGLPHPLLKEGVQVVMTPTVPYNRAHNTSIEFLRALLPEVLPIIVYAISRDDLSDAVSVRSACA